MRESERPPSVVTLWNYWRRDESIDDNMDLTPKLPFLTSFQPIFMHWEVQFWARKEVTNSAIQPRFLTEGREGEVGGLLYYTSTILHLGDGR